MYHYNSNHLFGLNIVYPSVGQLTWFLLLSNKFFCWVDETIKFQIACLQEF